MALLQPPSSLLRLVDIEACNPWWTSDSELPPAVKPRADLRWRVKNAQENELLIIPGPPGTGKTKTLMQMIRVLTLGHDYEYASTLETRVDFSKTVDADHICYIPCDDPLARFVNDFVLNSVNQFLAKGPTDRFYVLLDGVHRLPNWRDQINTVLSSLTDDLPDTEWRIVATVSSPDIVDESQFVPGIESSVCKVQIDLPHYSQKFRTSLFDHRDLSGAEERIYEEEDDEHVLARVRDSFEAVALGEEMDAADIERHFVDFHKAVLSTLSTSEIEAYLDQYLLTGGFESAVRGQNRAGDEDGERRLLDSELTPVTDPRSNDIEQIHEHILNGLEATIYREIPQLVKDEESLNRIEEPSDLHTVAAFLARRGYQETSYSELSSEFDRDSRTIKTKYTDMLRRFGIISKSTRCDLQRERTVRFFFRSPGYVSALERGNPLDKNRDGLLQTAVADHLHRARTKLTGARNPVEYWKHEGDILVDFAVETKNGTMVPFVADFLERSDSPSYAFEQFAQLREYKDGDDDSIEIAPLEVVLKEGDTEISTSDGVTEDAVRLEVPHWVFLLLC